MPAVLSSMPSEKSRTGTRLDPGPGEAEDDGLAAANPGGITAGGDSMQGISDIRISGLDPARPPRIRKEPYIDLHFCLSRQPPAAWCEDFNAQAKKAGLSATIKPEQGTFIDCWVRTPDEIVAVLERLKLSVQACSTNYIARIEAAAEAARQGNSASLARDGEQGRLNRIVAGLRYDD